MLQKNAFEATQKSFNVAEERVKAGLSTQLELNLAKNTLINTQSRLTQSKYEYLFNKKLLDFYQGIDITLK